VSCTQDLLVRSHSRTLKLIFNGLEPIIGIQKISGLCEGQGIGVLEVPKLCSGLIITIATIVIVGGGG
jgi:hypothetical protein